MFSRCPSVFPPIHGLPQGFQGSREHSYKIIGNKGTKEIQLGLEHGNKSCDTLELFREQGRPKSGKYF